MVDCGVFFFNSLFALTGIAVLTVGAFSFTAYNHYHSFFGEELRYEPAILMVIGAIVFIIALLGFYGAIKESPCMIFTFSVSLAVIILFEIGIGVFGYVQKEELKTALDKGFTKTFQDYEINKEAWAMVQSELKCCGVTGPEDYKPIFNSTELPKSCCSNLPQDKKCTVDEDDVSKGGCQLALFALLSTKSAILTAVALAVGLIQIVGLGFAGRGVYRAFRRNYDSV